ncbi:hypothetical protein GE061_004846 [Apolygus lucorum]|uniref:Uncharacterized protein n=1 Tax=Apolygus lucorum TaxID=248454 RepID=A0A6A4INB1_APOLU|nr:hypothetical protein GE061_004846 [Apolygus lucorum]
MTMTPPINQQQGLIHQHAPSASTTDEENPEHLECRLVLKRVPLEDSLKWQRPNSDPVPSECQAVLKREPLEDPLIWERPNSASTKLDDSAVPSDELNDVFKWVSAIEERASPVPSSSSSSDQYDEQFEELERTVVNLRRHVVSMEKVISRQKLEISRLKDECYRKQCKIDQLDETIRDLNERYDVHQDPSETFNRPFGGGKKDNSVRRSGRKRKLGADFSLIYFALDQVDENQGQKVSEERKSIVHMPEKRSTSSTLTASSQDDSSHCLASKKHCTSSTLTASSQDDISHCLASKKHCTSSTLTASSQDDSSHCLASKKHCTSSTLTASSQDDISRCSESIIQEKVESPPPPLRLSVIPTERLIEKPTVKEISPFPDGWFKQIPSSPQKPPIPRNGCCLICYEKSDNIVPRRHICENCRLKIKIFTRRNLKNPDTFSPRCDHKLNQPMRGCEGCIIRSFILRNSILYPNKAHFTPYNVDVVGYRNSTMQPDSSSNQGEIRQLVGLPGDSSALETSQEVLPGLLSDQIQNNAHSTASKTTQISSEDITLASLLRDSPKPSLPVKGGPPFKTTYQAASTQNSTSLVDATPQPSGFPKPLTAPKISPFPDNRFLVVPDFANKPPTPYDGFCFSCYEPKVDLMQNHCDTCWDKAKKLREAYLNDPETPTPRCNHALNRPMRGCEACILRVFIVRYNLRFPDRCFPVPYNKVDVSDQFDVNAVTTYFSNPNAGLVGSLVNRESVQHRGAAGSLVNSESEPYRGAGEVSNFSRYTSLLSYTPGKISEFPNYWFSALPSDPNELPTPQANHCKSCYELKQIRNGYCMGCRKFAKVIESSYAENPNVILPRCNHRLNLPKRGCSSCILRAYILTYNRRNPDKLFMVPYERIDSESVLKNSQNIRSTQNNSDKCVPDSLELRIVATRTLQTAPNPYFPDGWFQTVPDDEYELPIPRVGSCLSCYEYKPRGPNGHCDDCEKYADKFIDAYCKDEHYILQCSHKLNKPMRGCNICIIRAYIIIYNRRNPSKHFTVPYKCVDSEIPSERIHQLMQSGEKLSSSELTIPVYKFNTDIGAASTDSNQKGCELSSIKMSLYIVHPFSTVKKSKWAVRFPQPYPPNWFLYVPEDPNEAPTPKPSHCFSCYEHSKWLQKDRYCIKCVDRIHKMEQGFYKSLGSIVPECEHRLNEPMRNCVVCHMRAYAFSSVSCDAPDNT